MSSAGENLAVAAIDPAWVLPVLSAQGGAEAMGQSIEKGESAGKTLAGGLAKFGAGWAINSVGAADLAKTMGSDYAKNTLAGKLADMVRSVADNGVLAQQYPTVANAVSGGIDNAMQAFACRIILDFIFCFFISSLTRIIAILMISAAVP